MQPNWLRLRCLSQTVLKAAWNGFSSKRQQEELRFSWWKNDNQFVCRPLDATEDELLELFQAAVDEAVMSPEFRKKLKALLKDRFSWKWFSVLGWQTDPLTQTVRTLAGPSDRLKSPLKGLLSRIQDLPRWTVFVSRGLRTYKGS